MGHLSQRLHPSIKGPGCYQGTFTFPHSSYLRAPFTASSLCPFRPGRDIGSPLLLALRCLTIPC